MRQKGAQDRRETRVKRFEEYDEGARLEVEKMSAVGLSTRVDSLGSVGWNGLVVDEGERVVLSASGPQSTQENKKGREVHLRGKSLGLSTRPVCLFIRLWGHKYAR
jgi:hypothetical protein